MALWQFTQENINGFYVDALLVFVKAETEEEACDIVQRATTSFHVDEEEPSWDQRWIAIPTECDQDSLVPCLDYCASETRKGSYLADVVISEDEVVQCNSVQDVLEAIRRI